MRTMERGASAQLGLLVDAQNQLGEGVLWCERSGRVFWTDIEAAQLHCHDPAAGSGSSWQLPERLACFAFTSDPEILLAGLASGLAWFNLRTGATTMLLPVEADLPATRINDGRCDRQGRFVFGTMDQRAAKSAIASFYRLNTDLSLERLPLPRVAIANSICFSIDGRAMYLCDSIEKVIYRWDGYASGDASDISIFADLRGGDAAPDGSTIDADGHLWNAQWGGGRVVRYAPDGKVERTLALAVSQPSCVCLGGSAFNDVFVTSAQASLSVSMLAGEPHAGGLFHAAQGMVCGLPEVRFGASL
jgi:L-arabinonolactonase